MTADNDIVERLRALSRCEHSDLSVGDEAAAEIVSLRNKELQQDAEIVRLRGEVEAMEQMARMQAARADAAEREASHYRTVTIAPAEAKAAPQVQVNPCKCIDCGGDEPGHSDDCTYMAELHGNPTPDGKVRVTDEMVDRWCMYAYADMGWPQDFSDEALVSNREWVRNGLEVALAQPQLGDR